MRFLRHFWKILKASFAELDDVNLFTNAAALAYYTIFSLPPMLVIILYASSYFYREDRIESYLFEEIGDMIGQSGADQLRVAIEKVAAIPPSWWASVLGIGIIMFTSTTVLVTMQNALNQVFDVKPKPKGIGIWKMLRDRLISFTLLLGFAFILMISLTVNSAISFLINRIEVYLGLWSAFIAVIAAVLIPLLVITILFMLILKFLPDVKLSWKETFVGALLTSLLFIGGKDLISIYIGQSSLTDIYETAGSVMIMMVWIFYASVIFLFGAIFTRAYARDLRGGLIPPSDYAVKVENHEIELPES